MTLERLKRKTYLNEGVNFELTKVINNAKAFKNIKSYLRRFLPFYDEIRIINFSFLSFPEREKEKVKT